MPDGLPLGAPEAQDCCWPELPLFEEDDESPEPQATRARGESASRATAGTRRTRFMRNNSKKDEGVLSAGTQPTRFRASLGDHCPQPVSVAKRA
jgi:hypothetical protein